MHTTFTNQLHALKSDRFALQSLSLSEFAQFYADLLASFDITPTATAWYLVGTEGCHLCEQSKFVINTVQLLNPHITLIELDLIDGTNEVLDALGASIPILMTPKNMLCYPFGVMDVLALMK